MFTTEQIEAAHMELIEEGDSVMSRVKLELVGTKYKELVDTCVKRVEDGLDCSGCPFENSCDDFIREVVGVDARIFDR